MACAIAQAGCGRGPDTESFAFEGYIPHDLWTSPMVTGEWLSPGYTPSIDIDKDAPRQRATREPMDIGPDGRVTDMGSIYDVTFPTFEDGAGPVIMSHRGPSLTFAPSLQLVLGDAPDDSLMLQHGQPVRTPRAAIYDQARRSGDLFRLKYDALEHRLKQSIVLGADVAVGRTFGDKVIIHEELMLDGVSGGTVDGAVIGSEPVEGVEVVLFDDEGLPAFRFERPVVLETTIYPKKEAPAIAVGRFRVWIDGGVLVVDTVFDGAWFNAPDREWPITLDPTVQVIGTCETDTDCDDGNGCTVDTCVVGVCDHRDTCAPAGCTVASQCDDGNVCTNDYCTNPDYYACAYGPSRCSYADNYPNTTGYWSYWCSNDVWNVKCLISSGYCSYTPRNGIACSDGKACTVNDVCSNSSCASGPVSCVDGNACTIDNQCNGSGNCTYPGVTCNDGSACTTDSCNTSSGCVFSAISCNDGNVCTNDSCNASTGCVFANNTVGCNDGNPCTVSDYCSAGTCRPGSAVNCNDNNVCTTEYCNTSNGACVYTNLTSACDDGNACTLNDTCSGGSCVSGAPKNCDDGNVCTNDSCSGGVCSNVANSIACNDGNSCSKNDTCVNKSCVGTPYSCDDGLSCTSDSCNGSGGCTNSLISGNCLIGGVCYANGTVNSGNSCQACTTATSTTAWTARTNVACNDGNVCTHTDKCNASAACVGTGYSCNDGKVCTTDTCDGGGGCSYSLLGGYCDISNVCYTNGTTNPSNNCQQCATASSTGAWSDKADGTSYGTCSTGMQGECGAGKYECFGGQYYCVPNLGDYGAMTTVTVPSGLMERSTGVVTGGHQMITSDGRYLYNVSYGRGAAYNGYRYKQFDPRNGFSLVAQRDSGAVSFYMDGVVADAPHTNGLHAGTGYLNPIEWTGGIGRIDRIQVSNGALVATVGQVPQGSPTQLINGQYDWLRDKVFMGSLTSSNVARWAHGATWAPTAPSATTSNWEIMASNGNIAGAGVVASDGTYMYVKRWATYQGDDILRRVGTGYNGTTFGAYYGVASDVASTNSLGMTFMPDGYVYNPRSGDSYTLERFRVNASTWEICDGKDNDCDGFIDEDFTTKGQVCDGADSDLCLNGTFTCRADGTGVECVNESPQNIPEVCDLADNDCDGQVDEGFGLGATCDGPDPDSCSDDGVLVCNLATGGTKCEDRGPTTWFTFDEGTGGVANDMTGNGTNGTIAGPAWTTTAKYGGNALYFNGGAQHVEFGTAGIDTRRGSISMWVRPDFNGADATARGMFQTNSGVNNPGWIGMFKWTGNIFYFRMSATGDCCTNDVTFAPSGYLVSGTWTHLAATWDQTNNAIKVYVNGALIAQKTSGINWNIPATSALARVGLGHDAYFLGRIDDFAVYSYELTQAELQTVMNGSVESKYMDFELCDGLDNNCRSGVDEGYDKGTACSAGVGQCAISGSKVCQSPGYTTVCSVTSGKTAGTVCNDGGTCTYPDQCNGGPSSTCIGTPYTCNDGLTCTADTCDGDGTCTFTVTTGCAIGGVCYAEGTANPSNQCQSCVSATSKTAWTNRSNGFTCNADNNGCTTNDTCQSGTCAAGAAQACADAYTCTNNVCTSTGTNTYSCSNPFKAGECLYGGVCAVQDVTTCDSASDVDLCTDDGLVQCSGGVGTCADRGPTTYFPFDEGSGTLAYDLTGNGDNATLFGDTTWTTTSKYGGRALTFDGNGDYGQFASDGISPTQGTVSVWLRPGFAGASGTGYGVFQTQNGVNLPGWITLFKWTGDIFYFRIVPSAGCCGNDLTFAPSPYFVSGTWVHLAATWEQASDSMKIYINGNLVASRSGVNWGIAAPAATSRFGQGHDAFWLGQMDDMAVYGYALTQSEIQSVMNGSLTTGPDTKYRDFELCDGVDNDCDGATDEGWDKSACTAGVGQCANTGAKVCDAGGYSTSCNVTGKPVGTTCDDGDLCSSSDRCTGGASSACAGTAYTCNDGLACTSDACTGTGACTYTVTTGCAIGGVCYGEGVANPANACQVCTSASSKTAWSSKSNGTACNADSNGCTVNDTCQSGTCTAGAAPSCDDAKTCTADSCTSTGASSYSCVNTITAGNCLISGTCYANNAANPGNQCQQCTSATLNTGWSSKTNGTTCNADSNGCTVGDACQSGTCAAGPAPSCDDAKTCTTDVCNSTGTTTYTCTSTIDAGSCLVSGVCYTNGTVNPGNQCQQCTSASSQVAWSSKSNGTSCNADSNGCTANDACQTGTCTAGAAPNCADAYTCTTDSCASTGAASYTCNHTVNNGTCLIGTTCYGDSATSPTNQCERCWSVSSKTAWTDKPNGTTCDDGSACSTPDTCTAGVCAGPADPQIGQACDGPDADSCPDGVKVCSGATIACEDNGAGVYLKFSEGSGTSAGDSSGNGNAGALVNGTLWAGGPVGNAVSFDGLNDYVEVPHSADVQPTTEVTVAMWVKPSNVDCDGGNNWRFVAAKDPWNTWNLIYEENQTITWTVILGGQQRLFGTGGKVPYDVWTHVAFTYDAATGSQKTWINGVQDVQRTGTTGIIGASTGPLRVGNWSSTAACPVGSGGFPGQIDEVLTFNRVLSPAEIADLPVGGAPGQLVNAEVCDGIDNDCDGQTDEGFASLGAACDTAADADLCNDMTKACSMDGLSAACADGPYSAWTFPENSGTLAKDSGGGGRDLNLMNGTTWAAGKQATALSFDGVDDYAWHTGWAQFAGFNEQTISVWIRPTASVGDQYIISSSGHNDGNGCCWRWRMWRSADRLVRFALWDGDDSAIASAVTAPDNAWTHVVVTFKVGGIDRIFVNGQPSGTVNTITSNSAWGYLHLGAYLWGGAPAGPFKGQIDEVSIFTRELTAAQIAWLYGKSRVPVEQVNYEYCDGLDNDCKSGVDDGHVFGPCDGPDTDFCLNGALICAPNLLATTCGPESPTNIVEACNGADDDCDGLTDETWPTLGQACDGADSDLCKNGVLVCATTSTVGCGPESPANIVETCNGLDDDCDGQTDEGFTVGASCDGTDSDLCKNGTFTCKANGTGVECVNESPTNITEKCNGIDDDCDGTTDEDFTTLGQACDGPDSDQCKNGALVCNGAGTGVTCGPESPTNIVEICNGLDDDCNGQTDETFNLGASCDGPDPDSCSEGTRVCKPDASGVDCAGEPVVYLKLDEGTGATAYDSSSYANHATVQGATWTTGNPGGAMLFSGAQWLEVPNSASNRVVGPGITMMGWVYWNGTTGENMLVNKESTYEIAVQSGVLKCAIATSGGTWFWSGAGAVPANTWTHIACTHGPDNQIRTYVGGVLTSTQANSGNGTIVTNNSPLLVGRRAGASFFNGKLDEVAVFDLALTGAKIAQIAGSGLPASKNYEYCDGADNDCNGQTDELFGTKGAACDGSDSDLCKNGTFTCAASQISVECVNETVSNITEKCNGIDDDCDGATDEDFPLKGQTCDGSDSDLCKNGTYTCTGSGAGVECVNETVTNIAEVCNGADDDCDGLTDEGFDVGAACTMGSGTCAAAAVKVCKGDGTGTVCQGNGKPAGTACDDSNDCTKTDVCSGGAASACAGVLYVCNDSLACTSDSCNGDGTCSFSINAGSCVIGGVCYGEGAQNPANECQVCTTATTKTAWSSKLNGTDCNKDSNGCTFRDACQAGVCVQGATPSCSDGITCTSDVCTSTGANTYSCSNPPVAGQCVIGAITTVDATSFTGASGTCTGTTPAAPMGLACTGGGCTAGCSTGSRYDYAMTTVAGRSYDVVVKVADYKHNCTDKIRVGVYKDGALVSIWDGAGINDWSYPKWTITASAASTTVSVKLENDACCGCSSSCSPTCLPLGSDINLYVDTVSLIDTTVGPCWASNVVNPANQCQLCNVAATQTAWSSKPNSTTCDADGSGCTVGDSCQAGTCTAGPAPNCGDAYSCTTDACSSTGATTYTCSNTIQAGKCLIAAACYSTGDTDPGNQCKQCTAATTQTAFSNKTNGTACNDASACTAPDTCTAGVCAGPDVPAIGQACDGADADVCAEGFVQCKLDKTGTICSDGAGLVLRFEEGAGTSAIDTSGNGRNGLIQGTGNGTTSYGAGKNGLYGINFAFSPAFPAGTTVTRVRIAPLGLTSWKMTFAAWVHPDLDGSRYIVSRTSTTANKGLEISAYGAIAFAGVQVSNGSSTHVMSSPLNTWTHIAVTYDGVTLRAYRNGVEKIAQALAVDEVATQWNSDIYLGQDQDSPNGGLDAAQAFSGSLDDVVWYERPLSPTEIVGLMNTGVPAADINHELCDGLDNDCDGATDEGWAGLGTACDGNDADLCTDGSKICDVSGLAITCRNDGPVGAWTFDEQTGATAHDASGWGNHGALSGGAAWASVSGRAALNLDGVDDSVQAPNSASLAIGGANTVEAWIWIDTLPPAGWGWSGIVAKGNLPRNYSLYLNTAGFLVFSTASNNPGGPNPFCSSTSTTKPALGQWVHVAAVNRGTDFQRHEYYINGVAAGSTAFAGECTFPMPTSAAPVTIGRTEESNRWFDGKIDLVAIYDRALSPAEIAVRAGAGIPALQLNEDVCDGADNNCNGSTDEAYTTLGQTCDGPDSDQCKNGSVICDPSAWATVCGPETVVDIAEKCNGVDDDCDGAIDEDFPLKGQTCDGADSDLCKNGTYTCTAAGAGVECVNETVTNIVEKCNGLDDDCDGLTDENWPTKGQVCDGADGDLCKNGTFTCKPDGSTLECVNETATNIVEKCNGLDDDCDGLTDETWAELGDPCDGVDVDLCKNGSFTCKADGSTTECVNESVTNIAETCNGVDDDCDGSVDEDFTTKGQACDGGDDDLCKDGAFTCKGDGTGVECVTDGPVAFYRFEEGSGATAASASGSVGAAALTGATWTTAGPTGYGKAIVLNGTTAYGQVAAHPSLDAVTDLTMAAWVKWGGNGATYQHIVDKGNGTAWTMFVVGATGEVYVKLNNGQWKIGTVPQGTWMHVAATYKKTGASTGAVVGYLDGVQKLSVTATFGALGTTSQTLTIGSAGPGVNLFKGSIDEVAIYRTALTPTKIAALFGVGEACNGLDDDCDGATDETFADKGAACDGVDSDQCKNGTFTCAVTLTAVECINETVVDILETCNGADDDCDGAVDEDFSWGGIVVGGACDGTGECGVGVVQCKTTSTATCSTNADGTASQAIAEKCNGKDDDCDGLVDEDYKYTQQNGAQRAMGQSCDGIGECGIGLVQCASLTAATCSTDPNGTASQAVTESCDGKDNDCDAATDEGYVYTQQNGQQKALGQGCDGIGECGLGTVECDADGDDATCSTDADGTEDESTVELCNGLDDSCNGVVDEGFVYQGQPIGGPCDGVGACGIGAVECFNAATARCSTEPGGSQSQAVPETCNSVDDDCDGQTDENAAGTALTQSCYTGPGGTNGVGTCKGGTATCAGGTYGACVGQVLPLPSDSLCDGKDGDCSGQTDEDYVPLSCGTGVCKSASQCVNGAVVACAQKPQTGDDTDCDGLDDDCDGQTDEAFIPTKYGKGVCSCLSTCVAGSEIACTPSSPPLTEDTTCNALDDDCDGATDESYSDFIACTIDSCVDGQGTSTPNHAACSDGEACTDDVCSVGAGGCVITADDTNTPDPAADDGNPCTDLICKTGTSQNVVDDTNVPDDGQACTVDACSGGTASHTMVADTCLIDGQCWAPGDVDPSAGCEVCAPLVSQTQWSNTVFSEGFGSGTLGQMTSTKLSGSVVGWQADSKRSVSPAHAAYFGDPISHTYDKGRVRARLDSPALALAAGVMHRLRFQIWMDTEMFAGSTDYDALVVRARTVDGSVDEEVWNSTEALVGSTGGVWRKIDVNLDPTTFGGKSVVLRFEFDSGDASYNDFEGVYLDDITLGTACCFNSGDCEDGDTCTDDYCSAGACNFTYLCDPACVPASNNVVLLVDRSSTMSAMDGGMSRWDWLTDALDTATAVYAPVLNLGLKVFPTSGVCSVSPGLDVGFHATQGQISAYLAGAAPASGSTPMAQALAAAGSTLQALSYANAHSTIVLVTDGGAGCVESPDRLTVVKQLAAVGIQTLVIGYGYGSGDVASLNELALAGGLPKPRANQADTWFYAATTSMGVVTAIDTALAVVSGERCDGLDDNCDGDVDEQVAATACNPECGIGGKKWCVGGGWGPCSVVPETEVCDGADNDCDGLVDEGWLPDSAGHTLGGLCSKGLGECLAYGNWVCNGVNPAAPAICSAPTVPPKTEVCNNKDDNCNGIVDDGLVRVCSTACGSGNETCISGVWVNCTAPPVLTELCNNIDDDCDGLTDEGASGTALQRPCDLGCGLGVESCFAGVWKNCTAQVPVTELCNDADDDCDGFVDEGPDNLTLTEPCYSGGSGSSGIGNCHGGTRTCGSGGVWGACVDEQLPAPETCDGEDNDCDGMADEGADGSPLSQDCNEGAGLGICKNGIELCETGTWSECIGSVQPQPEQCDGLDNDCDGQTDEDAGTTFCKTQPGCYSGNCKCAKDFYGTFKCFLD